MSCGKRLRFESFPWLDSATLKILWLLCGPISGKSHLTNPKTRRKATNLSE